MKTSILIADDHAVFRSGLRALLEKVPDYEVIGETGSGPETITAVDKLEPDVLLLDISLPGLRGTKVAQDVIGKHPSTAIVILTMHEDEYYLQECLRLGVRAYVLKKSTGTELLQAISAACRKEVYVDPALASLLIPSYVGIPSPKKANKELGGLTAREQEVCTLLAYGHTNAEAAEKLFISARTVETHRTNIMTKLNLRTRAELVRFAIDNGLLKMDD